VPHTADTTAITSFQSIFLSCIPVLLWRSLIPSVLGAWRPPLVAVRLSHYGEHTNPPRHPTQSSARRRPHLHRTALNLTEREKSCAKSVPKPRKPLISKAAIFRFAKLTLQRRAPVRCNAKPDGAIRNGDVGLSRGRWRAKRDVSPDAHRGLLHGGHRISPSRSEGWRLQRGPASRRAAWRAPSLRPSPTFWKVTPRESPA
jgi:hypothetical protein